MRAANHLPRAQPRGAGLLESERKGFRMAEAWAIKDWTDTFETWETRRLRKALAYIRLKVGYQSARYRILMATPGGPEAWGVFVSMLTVAGKTTPRGMFAREGAEMTNRLLAVESSVPLDALTRAIKLLTDPEIGWLLRVPIPTDDRITWDFAPCAEPAHAPENVVEGGAKPTNGHPKPQIQTPKPTTDRPKPQISAHTTEHYTTSPYSTATAASGANGVRTPVAAAAEISSDERERNRVRGLAAYIAKRPDWLPDGKPWISRRAAAGMALWGGLTREWWDATLREARDSKRTLANPAGYVIAQFKTASQTEPGGAA